MSKEDIKEYMKEWHPRSEFIIEDDTMGFLWLQTDGQVNTNRLNRYMDSHHVAFVKVRDGELRLQLCPE